MATPRKSTAKVESSYHSPPAKTPEARENQMIALAVDLAERQLREGTASSQVMTHFLKLGSVRESLEREKLKNENLLLQSRADQIASQERNEQLYSEAIRAFRDYQGNPVEDDY